MSSLGEAHSGERPVSRRRGAGSIRAIGLGMLANSSAVAPMFLVGTLAVYLRADLGFDDVILGVLVATAAATNSLASAPGGRITERIGVSRALRVGVACSGGAMIAIAAFAHNWLVLAAFLALAGIGPTFTQPATVLWLARAVPLSRHGLAFGLNQCAGPAASLVAGLSVPVVAATIGWRWAFAFVGVFAIVVGLSVPAGERGVRSAPRVSRDGDVSLVPMVVLTTGMALSFCAVCAFAAFSVSGMVDAGVAEGTAGLVFALGSLMAMVARLSMGHLADSRPRGQLTTSALMAAIGVLGFVALATQQPVAMMIGTPVVFAMAWGWQGLFTLAIVRTNPNAPAAATGIIFTGGGLGAVLGPIGFGAIAGSSYALAWSAAALATFLSAVLLLAGRHLVRRELLPRIAAQEALVVVDDDSPVTGES